MSYLNINNTEIIIYSSIPSRWTVEDYVIENYNSMGEQRFYEDGFRQLIYPQYDIQLQKLGEIYFDTSNDVFTYEVLNKTQQEIEAEILQEAKQNQQASVQKLIEEKLISELQNEDDNETILNNKDAYPIWEPNGELILLGTKLQAFNSENELSIFRCNQDILATPQFEPRLAVYAFDEIKMGGDYPIWTQPQVHNPYGIGDIVWYVNEGDTLYISTIDNNVHAPNIVAGAWEIYEI